MNKLQKLTDKVARLEKLVDYLLLNSNICEACGCIKHSEQKSKMRELFNK